MANKPHPQDPRGKRTEADSPKQSHQQSQRPQIPPAPQPPKSNSGNSSGGLGGVGSQVPMKQMPGVTLENYTTFTKEQLIEGFGNTSNAIRGLANLGLKPGPLSKHLDIRFQHARNVLSRPLKRPIAEARAQERAAQANQSQDKK